MDRLDKGDGCSKLRGWLQAIRAYGHTAKGRHDLLDYSRGLLIIAAVMVVLLLMVHYISAAV